MVTIRRRGAPDHDRQNQPRTRSPVVVLIQREDGTQVVPPCRGLRQDLRRDDYRSTSGGLDISACDGAAIPCLIALGINVRNVTNRVWSSIHRTSHSRSMLSASLRKRQVFFAAPQSRIAFFFARRIVAPKACKFSILQGSHVSLPDSWIAAGRSLLRSDKRLIVTWGSLRVAGCRMRLQCLMRLIGFASEADKWPLSEDKTSRLRMEILTKVTTFLCRTRVFTFVIRGCSSRAAAADAPSASRGRHQRGTGLFRQPTAAGELRSSRRFAKLPRRHPTQNREH